MKAQCSSLDIISTLPQNLIETILCLVPIKDAVRTSILSRKWRYKWVKIPKLVFDENHMFDTLFEKHPRDRLELQNAEGDRFTERTDLTKTCKLFYAIYQVLLMHHGPLLEFTLYMEAKDTSVEVDQIITYLLRNNTVKKFALDFELTEVEIYKLPSSIFSLHQLTDLYLCNCDLTPERTFKGFGSLTSLYLKDVSIGGKMLLRLVAGSPLLKSLSLLIDIFGGIMEDCGSAYELFKYLPVIENLSLSVWFLPDKINNGVPSELPSTLVNLKYLSLQNMNCGLPFLLPLIRSSPNLEKIKLQTVPCRDFVALNDYSDIWLEHLTELDIEGFMKLEPDMEIVKLILLKSPMLKKVSIPLHSWVANDDELKILRILLRSPRVSPGVEIIVDRDPLR